MTSSIGLETSGEDVADGEGAQRRRPWVEAVVRGAFAGSPEFTEYAARCREAMQIPQAAFCALEAYRWVFRSAMRLQGYRFVKLMQQPLTTVPTQQQLAEWVARIEAL